MVRRAVGLIGVGRMGLPVCANLVRAGHAVIASDIRPEREGHVRAVGATWASETMAVAPEVDVMITVLPGSQELRETIAIAGDALRSGATWIDMTSASPAAGDELRARVRGHGGDCVDAPLGGDIAHAEAGTLQLFVGGRAETIEANRGVLEAVGTINHVGDHGAGYTTKLLVNLLWFGQAVATGEALLLGRAAGLDVDVLRAALQRSAAASEFIRRDLESLLDGDYLRSFGLDRCCDQLDVVAGLADELEMPFELSLAVRKAYADALERYGGVDGELLAIALLEERAGIRLRRPS